MVTEKERQLFKSTIKSSHCNIMLEEIVEDSNAHVHTHTPATAARHAPRIRVAMTTLLRWGPQGGISNGIPLLVISLNACSHSSIFQNAAVIILAKRSALKWCVGGNRGDCIVTGWVMYRTICHTYTCIQTNNVIKEGATQILYGHLYCLQCACMWLNCLWENEFVHLSREQWHDWTSWTAAFSVSVLDIISTRGNVSTMRKREHTFRCEKSQKMLSETVIILCLAFSVKWMISMY